MDRLKAMESFVAVVEAGSFAAAAEAQRLSTSAVSRQVRDLEAHLGARLLNRTTRRLSLTDIGQSYYERSAQLLADLREAESEAGAAASEPRGTIRLTCSLNVGARRVAPAIAAFSRRHPAVRFDVSVSERYVDLVAEGFDLAVRIGRVGSDQLIARRLGSTRILLCAAPSYLERHGHPRRPADLAEHVALTYEYHAAPGQWRFTDAQGAEHAVRVRGNLHANNGDLLVAAGIEGLGLIYEPDFLVDRALARGDLVRVLPGYSAPVSDIWAVYPSRRHLSARVRLFVDELAACFAPAQ